MTKARLALIVGILIISSYPTSAKLNAAPSSIAAFYRMAIACVLLLPFAYFRKELVLPKSKVLLLTIFSGFFIAADVSLWNIAIKESTISQATLLVNLAPIWVGIASYFFLKNAPTRNFWIGTVIALFGMIVFVGVRTFINFEFDKAFIVAVVAGIFYAGYIISSKKALSELPLLPFFSLSLMSATVVLFFVNLALKEPFTGFSSGSWFIMLYQGIVVQLLAWMLINYAIKRLRATRVSLSLLSQAFLSAIVARIILNEPITNQMLLGGAIVILGVALTFYQAEKN
jgi:drug/metabolite transporter (DMT)-like permease